MSPWRPLPSRLAGFLLGAGVALAGGGLAAQPAAAAGTVPAAHPGAIAAPVVAATAGVAIRTGEHPGYSRVVFDLPEGVSANVVTAGADRWSVQLGTAAIIPPPLPPPRVLALDVAGSTVTLLVRPAVRLTQRRYAGHLVLDFTSAPPGWATVARPRPPTDGAPAGSSRPQPAVSAAPSQASMPASAFNAARLWRPGSAPPVAGRPERPVPPALTPAPLPVEARAPARASPARASPAAAPAPAGVPIPAAGPTTTLAPTGHPVVLPFSVGTGAAAFRQGDDAVAVFDESRQIEPAVLAAEPMLARSILRAYPAATVLRARLPTDRMFRLTRQPDGWAVAVVPAAEPGNEIQPRDGADGITLPVDRPGRAVAIPDSVTGRLLLVGTVRRSDPSGAGLTGEVRRTPTLALLPTWQGVAVAPRSDDLALRPIPAGFLVTADHAETAVSAASPPSPDMPHSSRPGGPVATVSAAPDLPHLRRCLDLPLVTLAALRRRLEVATGAAADLPAGGRGPARLDAAEALVALGMGAEAQALVATAMADDPRLADDPRAAMLGAAAAVLAGRYADARPLDDPTPGRDQACADESTLWRGLRDAGELRAAGGMDSSGLAAAAGVIAPRIALVAAYPAPLRAKILPLALETLIEGGCPADAAPILQARRDDPTLAFARALLDEHDGRTAEARAALDRLSRSADRDARARAAARLIELNLGPSQADAQHAADALNALMYAWRGDGRELSLRLREAELRDRAGDPRTALDHLREALDPVLREGWPDQAAVIQARMRALLARALEDDAKRPMPAAAFVELVGANADLLPDGPAGEALAERLAQALAALDLPDQAAERLARLVDGAPPGAARAALGAELAQIHLEQGDAKRALLALSQSAADPLGPDLTERRTEIFARATAAAGDVTAATGPLEALGTPPALTTAAQLFQSAGSWGEAARVWQELALKTVPSRGQLDGAQTRLLLDAATAAAQAGDQKLLDWLRGQAAGRAAPGRDADMLRMLASGPVHSVADLPRLSAELASAREAVR